MKLSMKILKLTSFAVFVVSTLALGEDCGYVAGEDCGTCYTGENDHCYAYKYRPDAKYCGKHTNSDSVGPHCIAYCVHDDECTTKDCPLDCSKFVHPIDR